MNQPEETQINKNSTPLNPNYGKMFGLISGSITTIGVIIGLWQSHQNFWIVISGILSVALSDSFSDGLGMYFSQRTEKNKKESTEIGMRTTFYKMLITLSYILPFLLFSYRMAIGLNIIWAITLVSYASYQINEDISINLFVFMSVIVVSYLGGSLVKFIIGFFQKNSE